MHFSVSTDDASLQQWTETYLPEGVRNLFDYVDEQIERGNGLTYGELEQGNAYALKMLFPEDGDGEFDINVGWMDETFHARSSFGYRPSEDTRFCYDFFPVDWEFPRSMLEQGDTPEYAFVELPGQY